MPRPISLLAMIFWSSCGPAPAPAPVVANVASEPTARSGVVVDTSGPLGVLALPAAAARRDDGPYWTAITTDAAAVVPAPAPLVPGQTYIALPAGGEPAVELTAGEPRSIAYGCEDNHTDMVPLDGAAVPAGLVWVLPRPVPAGWTPAARPLRLDLDSAGQRRWSAGDLEINLTRIDDQHAEFRIQVGAATVHDERVEAYFMEGATLKPLDLTDGATPGIPVPEAVFGFGPGGPLLVVVDRSGFEGVGFQTLFIGDRGPAREIAALGLGVYYCAF